MPNQDDSKWINYEKFTGFQTLADPSKIADGSSPSGQNTSVNEGDRISVRPLGYEIIGNLLTPAPGFLANIPSLHTFRKRNGENIMIRQVATTDVGGSLLQFYDPNSDIWQTLAGGYTNVPFGFADFNINADLSSYVYFGNGSSFLTRWNGAHGTLASFSNATGWIASMGLATSPLDASEGYVVGDTFDVVDGVLSPRAIGQVTQVVNGAVGSYTITVPGTGGGVSPGDILTVGTPVGVGGATIMVDTMVGNNITSSHIVTRGFNRQITASQILVRPDDTLSDARASVDTILNGHVVGFKLNTNESGYTAGIKTTTTLTGTGTNLTVEILTTADNSITLEGDFNIVDRGFVVGGDINVGDATGGLPIPNGFTTVGFSGNSFVGVLPDPTTSGLVAGSSVFQTIEEFPNAPKGSLLITYGNRLFISANNQNRQAVYFSAYGDPTDFSNSGTLVSAGTATSSGLFNLGEGGGFVTNFVMDEGSLYMMKQSIIYKATLTDSFYELIPLKPFDGKSQTIGAQFKTAFISSNKVIFATADNQILAVDRLETIDYPQASGMSYPIRPTIANWDVRRMRGISFNNRVYISAHGTPGAGFRLSIDPLSTTTGALNDRVLVYNVNTEQFDTPIIGWAVGSWTIYDNGTGDALYFGSDSDPNVYRVTGTPQDGEFPVTASHKTKRYDFGLTSEQKQCTNFFIYGQIAQNTILTVKAFLDEDGYTQTYTTTVLGTDTGLLYEGTTLNTFGANPFGVEVFGGNDDTTGMNYFRVYLVKNVKMVPFYNIQLEFSSAGDNQQWEVITYGFEQSVYTQPQDKLLYRPFN